MQSNYILMEYFHRYLRDIRGTSESTVKHYQDALHYISKYLVKAGKLEESIYEIKDIGELEVIKEFLYNDPEFVALNKRGHQMYSAGLNNYYRFAKGEEFKNVGNSIQLLDVKAEVTKKVIKESVAWNRSTIIKDQVLKAANYECEINIEHQTFTAKRTGQQYMEGHHIIPMKNQVSFDISLDVYANIVCLCPVCHRLLHHGLDNNKEVLLSQMYNMRYNRLVNSGIKLSEEEFIKITI